MYIYYMAQSSLFLNFSQRGTIASAQKNPKQVKVQPIDTSNLKTTGPNINNLYIYTHMSLFIYVYTYTYRDRYACMYVYVC